MRTFLAISIAFAAAACSKPPAYQYPLPASSDFPEWVYKGSGAQQVDGKPVLVGVGEVRGVRNRQMAEATAANRARAEIAKVLEVYSASLMKDYMASTTAGTEGASAEEQHVEQAVKTFAAATLQGVTIDRYWSAADGTTFAKAILDYSLIPELAKGAELDAKVRDFIRDNAQQSFDSLDKEEACHKVPGQPSKAAVDILFVIDNSGTMGDEQANLAKNFDAFFNNLSQSDLDFQVAVVTTDVYAEATAGRFHGNVPVMTPETPNLSDAFKSAVTVGTRGSSQEKGLEALRLALSAPNYKKDGSGPNDSFIRDGARLAVVMISDEEDQSPLPVTQYTAHLSQLKGGLKKITFASMTGGKTGCRSQSGNAVPGLRYVEATETFGEYGITESICQEDFAAALEQISGEIREATAQCRE